MTVKVTALAENKSQGSLKAKHGLALYIETPKHRLLFDLGADDTLFTNAKMMGIDLTTVDSVIISHGGALEQFLRINHTAKVYLQRSAFDPHYSKTFLLKVPIGLNQKLKNHSQIVSLDGDWQIDEELRVFTVSQRDKCYSSANDSLYAQWGKDAFEHEQSLLIRGVQTVLIMGCGHGGVVNIMEKAAPYLPVVCIGGYHLYNPVTKKTVPTLLLDDIAAAMQNYRSVDFYTCHCTGQEAFQYLSQRMERLFYLSCGETITI